MAKKFLDYTGLTTVWNKITTLFARKTEVNNVQTNLTNFMNTKGAANGLASLDSSGKVPSSQLPSYVDDVVEYANRSSFPATGEDGKIYISQNDNKTYRWSGSAYVEISSSLALGTTSSTAFPGDRGLALENRCESIEDNYVPREEVYQIPDQASNTELWTVGATKSYIEEQLEPIVTKNTQQDTSINNLQSELDKKVNKVEGKVEIDTSNNVFIASVDGQGSENWHLMLNPNYGIELIYSDGSSRYGFGVDVDNNVVAYHGAIEDNGFQILDESMALSTTDINAICV